MESIIRSINHIARLATLYREKELKKYGLGPMHHTYILNVCRNPGISQDALGQMIFVNKSNVARQLAVLEEKGYVRRQTSSLDGRRLLVYPTEKALEIFPVLTELLKQWNEQVLAGFSETEQHQLLEDLQVIKENSQRVLKKEDEAQ
ncbi:MarR family transcriptional regulator [Enterococcus sp.]|jgi:MarR family transcriptional regulator for hemolysin|uniref:MarR family winged helix-turn-helix transcriptional regulator n=1 Tax=Enterococcus sp. TaxID=35783 RepID=UPI0025C60837|nr:MarR family transcriptional regulator [Enterococcus sp.]